MFVTKMELKIFILICFATFCKNVNAYLEMNTPTHNHAFDQNLYEEVLDPVLCQQQIGYMVRNNSNLLLRFFDAGIRTPRGLLDGNVADFGNYFQCLAISEDVGDSVIEGKFCNIRLPLNQENFELPSLPELPEWPDLPWPEIPWPELNPNTSRLNEETLKRLHEYEIRKSGFQMLIGATDDNPRISQGPLSALTLRLGICIPKTCTTEQAINEFFFNITNAGLEYEDINCRLPNDKPWVAADYVALAIFSFIGFLTVLSTGYDLRHTVLLGNDPKKANKIYQSFSLYTNTRRLVTYTPVPGALECLDGVRAFAMMWVILGHTFVNQISDVLANPFDIFAFIQSPQGLWITTGPITVDTFFMLGGLLLVYTTCGKLSRTKLIKNLHLFYLNRILRMFPVLAAFMLIEASFLHRVSDGPNWHNVVILTHRCRVFWWSTLLHVQNFLNPLHMCLAHTWYLAMDVQLYVISPLILFWVLGGRRRVAWIALSMGLIISLGAASIYNFIMEFPSGPIVPARLQDQEYYMLYYYLNTLTRASPFFVGMIYGYLLHIYRVKRAVLSKLQVASLWLCATTIFGTVVYSTYPIVQSDWDNQIVDSIINSFMRPSWALAVGWIIFACVQGYGGPINWVLSLRMWKLLGRLSYAMYVVHYSLIFLVNSSVLAPNVFSVRSSLFKFLSDFTLAVLVAFVITVFVDSPCSNLIKLFLGGGQRRPRPPVKDDETIKREDRLSNGMVNNAYVAEEGKTSF